MAVYSLFMLYIIWILIMNSISLHIEFSYKIFIKNVKSQGRDLEFLQNEKIPR